MSFGLGIRHPVEFVQPPLVCGAAANPGPRSSVCGLYMELRRIYTILFFVFGVVLLQRKGLFVFLPLQWCSARCGVAVSARRGRRGVVPWCATCSSSLLSLLQAAPSAFSPLASSSTSLHLHMCTRFHYHLSQLTNKPKRTNLTGFRDPVGNDAPHDGSQ